MDISTIGFKEKDKYEIELLKKIRSNESFTEEEIVSLFDRLQEVDEKRYDRDRWWTPIETIFKVKDTYILLEWNEGLTEYQENEYDFNPYEVYYVERTIVVKEWCRKEKDEIDIKRS